MRLYLHSNSRLQRGRGERSNTFCRIPAVPKIGGAADRKLRLAAPMDLGISLALGGALISTAAEPPREIDGLVRVTDQQVDHLYVLPEADFAKYNRVRTIASGSTRSREPRRRPSSR